jgi:hypothetical protein
MIFIGAEVKFAAESEENAALRIDKLFAKILLAIRGAPHYSGFLMRLTVSRWRIC